MFVKFEVQEACEVFDAGKGIQPNYVGWNSLSFMIFMQVTSS